MEGNPSNKDIPIPNLSDLDARTEAQRLEAGSAFLRMEIDNQQIYGSKLEITYSITVINNSDLNFYETDDGVRYNDYKYGDYYIFGEQTDEASITINDVNNYLDNKLIVEDESENLIDNITDYKTTQRLIKDENDPYNVYTLKIKSDTWTPIYTQKNKENNPETGEGRYPYKTTARIVASKTLSQNESDFYFVNQSEVINMEVTDNPGLIEDVNQYSQSKEYMVNKVSQGNINYVNYFNYNVEGETFENPSRVAVLTIIPPTGFDTTKIILYSVIVIISGIIISMGIIIIKKKIL